MQSSVSNGRPTIDESRLDSLKGDSRLINFNPLSSKSTMWRIRRAAVLNSNNPASSSTTPRTCKCEHDLLSTS